jgi:hypothetical protein
MFMKNFLVLISLLLLCLIKSVQGSVFIIGNDTIYYENGIYFQSYHNVTYNIDTQFY